MDVALLIVRVLLALVFFVAGVAKLADRAGARQALLDFGVPGRLAAPSARVLAVVELTVAVALIPPASAWWGALGALLVLLVFATAIGWNMARGRAPQCRCFGQLHSAPAGWRTLARNGVLLAASAFVVSRGSDRTGADALSWTGQVSGGELAVVLGGLVVLGLLAGQWWFLFHVLKQNGRLMLRVEAIEAMLGLPHANAQAGGGTPIHAQQGLPVGADAPEFALQNLDGQTVTLQALRGAAKPVMLIFTDPGCAPCNGLLPDVARWQQQHDEQLTVALVSRGDSDENRTKGSEHDLTGVLLQHDWEVGEAYLVAGTPAAVLIGPEGIIATPVVAGVDAIRALVAHTVGEPAQLAITHSPGEGRRAAPAANGQPPNGNAQHGLTERAVGQPAPEVRLSNLQGKTVELKDFKGEQVLILFWDPRCGFCEQMLDDLKAWEADRQAGDPRLLVVSAGTAHDNSDMRLASTVVLDEQFAVASAFGASGTPSAVLVDAQGNVASDLAVGAAAVLELAQTNRAKT